MKTIIEARKFQVQKKEVC